jgi:bifunctional DNA-binding transcriptional regulator/antitoxin component of YhaV-PrlF toxin-antitoxin module
MTDQLIAPVIRSAAVQVRRRPAEVRPDVLPCRWPARPLPGRAITRVLGWHRGDRLTVTATAGVVIARRDPAGMVTLPVRPRIAIPAALRRRCGLYPGDRVTAGRRAPGGHACCLLVRGRGLGHPGARSR